MRVERVPSRTAKNYIRERHYSRSCHNGPSPCYGLFQDDEMCGCLCFATPCSENVRASVFGPDHKDHVTELHRMYLEDDVPKMSESWFIAQCLARMRRDKPGIWAVLTFADATEGHTGTVYQATNAQYCGTTGRATFFLDRDGRLRHPRQNGVNISLAEARSRGWTPTKRAGKHRYLYLLGKSKGDRRRLERLCLLEPQPYPR